MRSLVVLVLLFGCGAKSGLEVAQRDDAPDLGVGPCEPLEPALFSPVRIRPLDAEGGRVWGAVVGPDNEVGFLDGSGELTVVASDQFGTRSLVADGDTAFWSMTGLSDGAGAIMRGRAGGDVRTLVPRITQPGALDLDGDWVSYGIWTNLPIVGEDGRASVARVSRDGDRLEDVIDGRGMPTATAHLDGELHWLDRRRDEIATLPAGTLTPRIVAGITSVRRPMIAWNGALYVAAARAGGDGLIRVERTMPPEPFAVATVDGDVWHLVGVDSPVTRGIAIGLGGGTGGVRYYRLRDHEVLRVGEGTHPAVGARHLFWGTDEGVMHICLEALERL
jgi:hypothetical protein